MKKYVFITLALILTIFLLGSRAKARIYRPHSALNDPVLILQLHQQMDLLRDHFGLIEERYAQKETDYAIILNAVQEMQATRQTLQALVPNQSWKKPLRRLTDDLQKITTAATKQDKPALRKSIDGLYNSCFGCHSSNAPTY